MRGYAESDKPKGVASYKSEKICNDMKQLIPALGNSYAKKVELIELLKNNETNPNPKP